LQLRGICFLLAARHTTCRRIRVLAGSQLACYATHSGKFIFSHWEGDLGAQDPNDLDFTLTLEDDTLVR